MNKDLRHTTHATLNALVRFASVSPPEVSEKILNDLEFDWVVRDLVK